MVYKGLCYGEGAGSMSGGFVRKSVYLWMDGK